MTFDPQSVQEIGSIADLPKIPKRPAETDVIAPELKRKRSEQPGIDHEIRGTEASTSALIDEINKKLEERTGQGKQQEQQEQQEQQKQQDCPTTPTTPTHLSDKPNLKCIPPASAAKRNLTELFNQEITTNQDDGEVDEENPPLIGQIDQNIQTMINAGAKGEKIRLAISSAGKMSKKKFQFTDKICRDDRTTLKSKIWLYKPLIKRRPKYGSLITTPAKEICAFCLVSTEKTGNYAHVHGHLMSKVCPFIEENFQGDSVLRGKCVIKDCKMNLTKKGLMTVLDHYGLEHKEQVHVTCHICKKTRNLFSYTHHVLHHVKDYLKEMKIYCRVCQKEKNPVHADDLFHEPKPFFEHIVKHFRDTKKNPTSINQLTFKSYLPPDNCPMIPGYKMEWARFALGVERMIFKAKA